MSAEWDADDLARLLALEHAFGVIGLMCASNMAKNMGVSVNELVQELSKVTRSTLYDGKDISVSTRAAMAKHLDKLFAHIGSMAKLSDAQTNTETDKSQQ
jgi:hypothetical protein